MFSARTIRLAATSATALVLLTACGTTEESADTTDTAPAPAATGPVSVTDERGPVELDAPATKVVSLEWGLTENLLALGVTPVGAADVKGYNEWDTVVPLQADTPDVGQRGTPSLDAISALKPELIVSVTGLEEKVYEQLEDIAPVVVLAGSDAEDPIGYMRKTVNTLSEITGTQDQAATLLSSFDAKVAEAKNTLEQAGKTNAPFTMADGWVQSGTVSLRMYTPGSFFGAVAAEIGLDNQYSTGGDPEYGLATIDVEGLTKVDDAATSFLYVAGAAEGETFVDALGDNAIWKKLPFVEAGKVRAIENGIWMFGGPKAAEAYIDQLVSSVTAA